MSDSGVLIKTEVLQDPNAAKVVPGEPLYGFKAAFSDTELNGDIIHEDFNRSMALSYFHSRHVGAIRNATIQMDKISTWVATGDSCVEMIGKFDLSQIDAEEGVTICMSSTVYPDHREVQMISGGVLILN